MIKINEEYEVEFTSELNEEISAFAVRIGGEIASLPPLEKFYALKVILEELDGRVSMYSLMEKMAEQGGAVSAQIEKE